MQIQLCICVSYRPPKSRYKLSVHSKHSAWQVLHVLHLARILEFLRIIIYLQNLWKEWIKLQNTDLLLHLRPAPAALCPTHPWPVEAQVWAPPLWEAILPLLMFLKLHIGSLDIRWDELFNNINKGGFPSNRKNRINQNLEFEMSIVEKLFTFECLNKHSWFFKLLMNPSIPFYTQILS